jgi:hypothetical protein
MATLPHFTGVAVHDGWAPYDTYGKATHARCNAHLLRELQAVTDHHLQSGGEGVWCWAAQAADMLRTMKRLVDEALARDRTLNTLDAAKMTDAKHAFRSPPASVSRRPRPAPPTWRKKTTRWPTD